MKAAGDKINTLYADVFTRNGTKYFKKYVSKKNFIKYYFEDQRQINVWNRKNNLIKFAFAGFSIKLSDEFKVALDELFIKNILPVTKYLKKIMIDGWKHEILSIKEYNMIVYFTDFCNKLSVFEKSKQFNLLSYLKFEEAFFKLTFKDDLLRIFLDGLQKILIYYKKLANKDEEEVYEIIRNLEYFFSPKVLFPSVYELILAFNMVYFKRYLEWDDLIEQNSFSTVKEDFYECSSEVFSAIITYIEVLIRRINQLESTKRHIEWFKDFAEIKTGEEPVKIISFYEKCGFDWNKDKDDFFSLFFNLTGEIITRLKSFIFNRWILMTRDEKRIKVNLINDSEIKVLFKDLLNHFNMGMTRNQASVSSKFLLLEFLRCEYPTMLFTNEDQRFIYERITIILSILMKLSKKFNTIYIGGESKEYYFFNYMVVSPEEWRGYPVFRIFKDYIELFLQLCGFFREENLLLEIKRLPVINNSIKKNMKKLNSVRGTNTLINDLINKKLIAARDNNE